MVPSVVLGSGLWLVFHKGLTSLRLSLLDRIVRTMNYQKNSTMFSKSINKLDQTMMATFAPALTMATIYSKLHTSLMTATVVLPPEIEV